MNNKTTQTNITLAAPYISVSQAVAALTEPQLNRLQAIACRRLEKFRNSPAAERLTINHQAQDFVQEAIKLVLLGEVSPGEGRRTNVRHLASPQSFFNYLQGIMHSLIWAGWLRASHTVEYQAAACDASSARSVVQEVVFNEVTGELLAQLQKIARDNPALQAAFPWLDLDAPNTGSKPTYKQISKARRLGREILREAAAGGDIRDLFNL